MPDLSKNLTSVRLVAHHRDLQFGHVFQLLSGFDAFFQAVDFLLEQVQCPSFASVPSEGGRAGRMNGIDPFLQFNLAGSLQDSNGLSILYNIHITQYYSILTHWGKNPKIYPKIHTLKISFFTKFTFSKFYF